MAPLEREVLEVSTLGTERHPAQIIMRSRIEAPRQGRLLPTNANTCADSEIVLRFKSLNVDMDSNLEGAISHCCPKRVGV